MIRNRNCIPKFWFKLLFLLIFSMVSPTLVAAQPPDTSHTVFLPVVFSSPSQNQTALAGLQVYPTIEAMGIVSSFLNDINNNNKATIYYRPAGSTIWQQGPALSRDTLARQWRGSLVHLSPDRLYELEVRYEDGDGVTQPVVMANARTRPDKPVIGSNGVIRTVPTDGNLQTLVDKAQPGDTIRLLSGVYFESVTINAENSGTADHYITIEPTPGATVVFDGSEASSNGPGDDWTFYQNSNKGNIYYIDLPWGSLNTCGIDIIPGYVGELVNGKRVRYPIYDSEDDWTNDFLAAPLGKAFYVCNNSGPGPLQRLYVVTMAGDDPDNHEMHLARQDRAIHLRGADYIRIRGLQFRHYSTSAIHLGFDTQSGADFNIIENNSFHGIGRRHIRVSSKEGQEWTTNNLIQNNQLSEDGFRDNGWEWASAYLKGRTGVNGILLEFTGPGNIIRGNSLKGGHDGISVNRGSDNVDVYNNIITECMDDGVQVDNNPGGNIRVWHNTFNYCYTGLSMQSWNNPDAGPVYIFRNVIKGGNDPQGRTDHLGGNQGYATDTAFKVGSDVTPTGTLYIYHNTISILQSTNDGSGMRDSGGNYFANAVTRNNIWNVSGRVFYFNSAQAVQNHSFDCDNLHDLNPIDSKFVRWTSSGGPNGNGNYTTLATFQSQINQELKGISNISTIFNDNLELQIGSPDIDAGCIIIGFNDQGPYTYTGPAPDLGAFEFIP